MFITDMTDKGQTIRIDKGFLLGNIKKVLTFHPGGGFETN